MSNRFGKSREDGSGYGLAAFPGYPRAFTGKARNFYKEDY